MNHYYEAATDGWERFSHTNCLENCSAVDTTTRVLYCYQVTTNTKLATENGAIIGPKRKGTTNSPLSTLSPLSSDRLLIGVLARAPTVLERRQLLHRFLIYARRPGDKGAWQRWASVTVDHS
jgi:hypothetical protein